MRTVRGAEWAGSSAWRARQPLSGADLMDFLALRRVCGNPDSRVYLVGDRYVENERPVLPFLADGLTALVEVGHLTIGPPVPVSGVMCPVMVTASGRARYEDLCDRQGITAYPDARVSTAGDESMNGQRDARWVFDPGDSFAHLLAGSATAEVGMLVSRCGKEFPIERTATFSVPPGLAVCPACRPRESSERPVVVFPAPTHY